MLKKIIISLFLVYSLIFLILLGFYIVDKEGLSEKLSGQRIITNPILQVLIVRPYLFIDDLLSTKGRIAEPVEFKGNAKRQETKYISTKKANIAQSDSLFVVNGKSYANPVLSGIQIPQYVKNQQVIDHSPYYTIQFDHEKKLATWAAYYLTSDRVRNIKHALVLENEQSFKTDASLVADGANNYDFSDFTRKMSIRPMGLVDPLQMSWSEEGVSAALLNSNLVAAYSNSKISDKNAWMEITEWEREYVERTGSTLYIACGTLVSEKSLIIGTGVYVPDYLWKAILQYSDDSVRAIAFLVPNNVWPCSMEDCVVSIDFLEEILGYKLFSRVPEVVAKKIKSESRLGEWD